MATIVINEYSMIVDGVKPDCSLKVQYNGHVDNDVMRLLHSIILGNSINSVTIDVISYKTLYDCIKLCVHLNILNSINSDNWVTNSNILQSEYIYACTRILPMMVNFDDYLLYHNRYAPKRLPQAEIYDLNGSKLPELARVDEYFAGVDNPWAFIADLHVLNHTINSIEYVDALQYYSTYDIASAFTSNNQQTQEAVKKLTWQRSEYSKYMFIDPYSLHDYFVYTPFLGEKWSCDNITETERLKYAMRTIATYEEALNNLGRFSCGYLCDDFPYDNVVIAGGSISRILNSQFSPIKSRAADIDVFITAANPDDRLDTLKKLLKYFEDRAPMRTFFAVRNCVTSIYTVDVLRKFQIISNQNNSPYDVLMNFDTSHLQWYFSAGKFYGTAGACISLRTRCTSLGNSRRIKADRLIKAMLHGYDVAICPILLSKCNISDMITDHKNVRVVNTASDLEKYYYPRSEPDATLEDLRGSYIANIKDFAKCNIVTDSSAVCAENMQLGGIFDNDYELSLFTTFNINNLSNIHRNNRSRTQLLTRTGPLNMTSDMCTVTQFAIDDKNANITLRISEEFNLFITQLETNVYRLYYRDNVSKRLSSEELTITLTIPIYKIENQIKYGNSILRTHRGTGLNIEEDLHINDQMQFMFRTYLISLFNEKGVQLDIVKIIKYVNEDQPVDDQQPVIDDEPEHPNIKINYEV